MTGAERAATPPGPSGRQRPGAQRDRARERVLSAARMVASGSGISNDFLQLVQEQAGLPAGSMTLLFPTANHLLAALQQLLAAESLQRLRLGIDSHPIPLGGTIDESCRELAAGLLRFTPLERTAAVVRSSYRHLAISGAPIASDYRTNSPFTTEFADVLQQALHRAELTLTSPLIGTNTIVVCTERAFDDWIIDGRSDARFNESPFARSDLPNVLRAWVTQR